MAYRVDIVTVGSQEVYRLHDEDSGAVASILPGYGFNLFDLQLPVAGTVRPIIFANPDFAGSPTRPGRNGIPVLFPFPNRIRDAKYDFRGKSYELIPNKPPHAIHGFAIDAPWDLREFTASSSYATILGRFQISLQSPQSVGRWPADAILEMRYTLSGRSLTLDITVENPSQVDLPYGFGVHSYFHLPLDKGGDPARTRVVLPASEIWVQDESIPTGEKTPVAGRLDFREGQSMAGLEIDEIFTGLQYGQDNQGVCRLIDETLGAEVRLVFDRNFRELVVFTPPGPGGVIAVEPYTQTADAIHLQARGIDAGLRILAPGGVDTMRLAIETAW